MASGRRDLATRTLIVASLAFILCSLVGEAAAMGGGGGGDGGGGGVAVQEEAIVSRPR